MSYFYNGKVLVSVGLLLSKSVHFIEIESLFLSLFVCVCVYLAMAKRKDWLHC